MTAMVRVFGGIRRKRHAGDVRASRTGKRRFLTGLFPQLRTVLGAVEVVQRTTTHGHIRIPMRVRAVTLPSETSRVP